MLTLSFVIAYNINKEIYLCKHHWEVLSVATSSITKHFVVKDQEAFEKLKEDLTTEAHRIYIVESQSLRESREKLSTFMFH